MVDTLITSIANKNFDYVIAGAGIAGLTLAARLSEDPSISVLVLEAGNANLDDPNILLLGQIGKTLGNPSYDWNFQTVAQPYSNGVIFPWSRGKGLGGSSSINFYGWIKPPSGDIDAVEKLGNPGWGWNSYAKYSKKAETFHIPTEERHSIYPRTIVTENRGTDGPIQTSYPELVRTLEEPFQETLIKMGAREIDDPYGGDITGTWIASANLDPKTYSRSYAANAYYSEAKNRPNFTLLTQATVAKVVFGDRGLPVDELLTTGLEFLYEMDPGQVYVVHARKEVILSAGAIKTPQILELSGIGRKDILEGLGIDVKVELPGVGENVQEHNLFGLSYELDDKIKHETLDLLQDPGYAAEQLKLHAEKKGMHGIGITSFAYLSLSATNPREAPSLIAKASQKIEEQKVSGKLPPGLAEQLDLQLQALQDVSRPDLEIIMYPLPLFTPPSVMRPGKQYSALLGVLNHPLSRGTIHVISNDPMQLPEIDPHYFENDFDLEMMVQHVKFMRTMAEVEPWKSLVTHEVAPGTQCTTDQEIREWIKGNHGTCWHTVASCSMLPRDKNGVVNPELKVYGTQNLRIADLSILPIHIAAHTQVTAYTIGEKAADIIRGIH